MSGIDYILQLEKKSLQLTPQGCRIIDLHKKPSSLGAFSSEQIYEAVEKSLTAALAYQRGRDYVVANGEIVIVSESTGRAMAGRKWQDGLHQAIEAKEELDVTAPTVTAARITVQNYFKRYECLAGLTGTAIQARSEFRKYYRVGIRQVPPNRKCIREIGKPRLFLNRESKLEALVSEVRDVCSAGRAVLIGTPSVAASEYVGAALQEAKIEFELLNAVNHEREAEIVSRAGEVGQVTVATNMAGRGTDIELAAGVKQAGGLHVIATALHSSKRIDRQLIGRCARQGDPGSCNTFLSLDDELLQETDRRIISMVRERATGTSSGELGHSWFGLFQSAQRRLESGHKKARKRMFKRELEREKKCRRVGLDPFLEVAE